MEAFQQGLKLDKTNKDCIEGYRRTTELIQNNVSESKSGKDDDRRARAMADPEIRMIMSDPVVQQVL